MNDEIKVYKDQKLFDLGEQWRALSVEETGFLLDRQDINNKGRTMTDVARDMVVVYKQTNEHLKNQYPDNDVAKAWIATNEFGSQLVEETWL